MPPHVFCINTPEEMILLKIVLSYTLKINKIMKMGFQMCDFVINLLSEHYRKITDRFCQIFSYKKSGRQITRMRIKESKND